jgi:plastocyanin
LKHRAKLKKILPAVTNMNKILKANSLTAIFIVIILASIYLIVFVLPSNSSSAKVTEIHITASGFQPASVVIKAGTKIVWINDDNEHHQVASNPYPKDNGLPGFKSEILNKGQTYEYAFTKPGTFDYHDDQNPTTNATVGVE